MRKRHRNHIFRDKRRELSFAFSIWFIWISIISLVLLVLLIKLDSILISFKMFGWFSFSLLIFVLILVFSALRNEIFKLFNSCHNFNQRLFQKAMKMISNIILWATISCWFLFLYYLLKLFYKYFLSFW